MRQLETPSIGESFNVCTSSFDASCIFMCVVRTNKQASSVFHMCQKQFGIQRLDVVAHLVLLHDLYKLSEMLVGRGPLLLELTAEFLDEERGHA